MHFTIETSVFRKGVDATGHATSTSNLTPILENILIDVQYNRVVLTGNNLDMAIEYIVDTGVEIQSEGKFTVSSKFLSSYISLVKESHIEVSLGKNETIIFKTSSGETKFKGMDAENFPTIPNVPQDNGILINAKKVKSALTKTLFSTADGNVRPMLAGIYIRSQGDNLIFASTDSFRLSDLKISMEKPIEFTPIIIPARTAMEVSKLTGDTAENMELHIHESQIQIKIEKVCITSRLLSGKFPDYQSFFPEEHQTKTTLLRNDLINALKQVNLVARQNNYNTRLRSHHDGKVEIFTGDTEVGNSTLTISGTTEGQEDTVGINSQYLLDVLSIMREDYISFEYKNPLSPVVIRGVAEGENDFGEYRHLIMPLKI
ncbi:DNA polymerase III subunit beta [Candidatus Gracilibacteria bacterium]|nr:MAG: DNA polymerase III subunit beta [Candidatus Gracilibacteria bacterium]